MWLAASATALELRVPMLRRDLKGARRINILVCMTRKLDRSKQPRGRHAGTDARPGHWVLQDAKARFSELVRRVRSEGPQHVTVHGRDEVVVIAVEELRRLKGERTGDALIAAMQASPLRDIDLDPKRGPMPVRDVEL
jgi:prevent-host-death family protein